MVDKTQGYSLFWYRRDLRVEDNKGLSQAAHAAEDANRKLVCIYILTPQIISSSQMSSFRLRFFYKSLLELSEKIAGIGSELLIFEGEPVDALKSIIKTNLFKRLDFNEDYEKYSRNRDQKIRTAIGTQLKIVEHVDQVVFGPRDVLKADQTPYTVFTPYKKAWYTKLDIVGRDTALKNYKLSPSQLANYNEIQQLKKELLKLNLQQVKFNEIKARTDSLPTPTVELQTPGSNAGYERLKEFINNGVNEYALNRNRLDVDGTSRLSAHFKFGTISIREAFRQTITNPKSEVWRSELIWREFYKAILANFPSVENKSFQAKFAKIHWENDNQLFEAWCQGKTGYPYIDAGIRQLLATGWMHNRSRMAVAMFLCKDLLIDWRWGEKFFMQHLIDADISANNGGWQWSASTGTDAAPYFRIFNPVLQGLKFDPEGSYVRKWVPELSRIPGAKIHTPWELSAAELELLGIKLGRDYPNCIVDHNLQRHKALKLYSVS